MPEPIELQEEHSSTEDVDEIKEAIEEVKEEIKETADENDLAQKVANKVLDMLKPDISDLCAKVDKLIKTDEEVHAAAEAEQEQAPNPQAGNEPPIEETPEEEVRPRRRHPLFHRPMKKEE